MAYIRQLRSGLWAGTVYTPAGRRYWSHELKGKVRKWAEDLEADIRRGDFVDPKLAEATVGVVWERLSPARRLELASGRRDASHWKCWVQPRWGPVEVGRILKPDVQIWVNEMDEDGVGGWTIIAAVNLLKALLELAVDARMIRSNPARRVKTPMPPDHEDRVLDGEEEAIILRRCDQLFPGRRDARLFIEGLLETGTRWEELAAVRKEKVDVRADLIHIGPVMERNGTIRDYPKGARTRSAAGFRPVPVGKDYMAGLKPVVFATPPGGLIYTAPRGGPLRYESWRDRVWNVVVHGSPERILTRAPIGAFDAEAFGAWLDDRKQRAGISTDRELARLAKLTPSLLANWRADRFGPTRAKMDRLAAALGVDVAEAYRMARLVVEGIPGAGLDDPQPTPHDCRHSYGTRLADAGVELHHRMELMGHRDVRSGNRYTHSNEARFDKAREALKLARGGRG